MSGLIKREDAIRKIDEWIQCGSDRDDDIVISEFLSFLKGDINSIPSADRPRGEWEYTNDPLRLDDEWACSRCGNISFVKTNFCDRCGAKMKGADDE